MYLYYCLDTKKETITQQTSKALLREALKDYNCRMSLGLSPELIDGIETRRGKYGKPYFPGLPDIHFSITHSRDCWACAMAEEAVGVDMEFLERKRDIKYLSIAKRYFTEEEQRFTEAHGVKGFFQIWVRKEAYVKYIGRGLAYGLSAFDTIKGGALLQQVGSGWIKEEDLCHGYLTAICTEKETIDVNVVELERTNE